MPHHIKNLLSSLFAHSDDWRIMLLRDWPTILGDLAKHVLLEKIEHDTLILSVHNACWMHELYMLSPLLLKTINKKLDQPRIKRLRFKQAGLVKKKKDHSNHTAFISPKQELLTQRETKALTAIEDPQLRNALKQFLHRCQREKI